MRSLINKPYNLLESVKFRSIYVFGGVGFVIVLLWVFEPFGLHNLSSHQKLITICWHIGFGLLFLIIQFFLFQPLFIKKHTFLTTIFWLALSFFLAGTSGFIINAYLFNNGKFFFNHFILFQGIILSIGLISVFILVLIHYNYLLRKRLKIANQLNEQIRNNLTGRSRDNMITFESENKKDVFKIPTDNLLYITVADNYIDIFYLEAYSLKHKLIRNSLTNITKRYSNNNDILRCHKSYIVNKHNIESISGNAAGYKIKLRNCQKLIPVSRTLNKTIYKLLDL